MLCLYKSSSVASLRQEQQGQVGMEGFPQVQNSASRLCSYAYKQVSCSSKKEAVIAMMMNGMKAIQHQGGGGKRRLTALRVRCKRRMQK